MKTSITRLILYAKNVDKVIDFYELHFAFKAHRKEGDRIIELIPEAGGVHLLIHPAGKGMKQGQSAVKIVFDVEQVEEFKDRAAEKGLVFGVVHQADGYFFANGKDPAKNAIQISSRAFAGSLNG